MATNSSIDIQEANKPIDENLMRFVWHHTRRQQIWIFLVILFSMPTYFLVFDLPKQIINGPIVGGPFGEGKETVLFPQISLPLPDWISGGGSFLLFEGWTLDRFQYLLALSLSFLALVIVNGAFKFYINTYKGRLGERMLRRIRYQLVDRLLRFPVSRFRHMKPSEIASMIKDEIEPFGEFIGDAFALPVFLGGQAIIAFVFISVQNIWLGALTLVTLAIQIAVLPPLRRRVIELGRKRQIAARKLSGRISEIVDGISAVHVNDASNYERAEIVSRLGRIFFIRFELFKRKFLVKFVSNFLAQVTPFLFYLVGGYFAIRGTLDIGQLVAAIAAYKELPSPVNGLIFYDQKRVDIKIKYALIVEQFNAEAILDADQQAFPAGKIDQLQGAIKCSNLNVTDESGTQMLKDITLEVDPLETVAVAGIQSSGAETFAAALVRLETISGGSILLDGNDITKIPESLTGRSFGYVDGDTFLPQGTVLETLLYSLKHAPAQGPEQRGKLQDADDREMMEARLAGNPELKLDADWVNYEAVGAEDRKQLQERIREVLKIVELDSFVIDIALRRKIASGTSYEIEEKIDNCRKLFAERIANIGLSGYIEWFKPNHYNKNLTIAENILFGTADKVDLEPGNLVRNSRFLALIADTELDNVLFDMGISLAEAVIELFSDLSSDNPFLQQLNFMDAGEITEFSAVLKRVSKGGCRNSDRPDREKLIHLALRYCDPSNKLGLINRDIEQQIVNTRNKFREQMPRDLLAAIDFFDSQKYNYQASIQDNIVMGRLDYRHARAAESIQEILRRVIDSLGLSEAVFELGLQHDIGTGGKRLTEAQRQKMNFARALLKRPNLLILNKALSMLDVRTHNRILRRVLELARGNDGVKPFGVIWVLSNLHQIEKFERLLVFKDGQIIEDGAPVEIRKRVDLSPSSETDARPKSSP